MALRKCLSIGMLSMTLSSGVSAGDMDSMQKISASSLCVTEGKILGGSDGTLQISESKTRAVLGTKTAQSAEIQFKYFGPTAERSRLGSGEERTQIGIKLRAQDSCNLVYVMWRILPESRIVVSIKNNPGMHSHSECKNGGYRNLRMDKQKPVPGIQPGSSHALRADLSGLHLSVHADQETVWDGELDNTVLTFDGPVGLRTDNGRFEVRFYGVPGKSAGTCSSGGEE